MTIKSNQTEQAIELRKLAEKTATEKTMLSPESLKALSAEETHQVLHELQVHQIELEMQNDELRRTQIDLDATRTRYFDLYDLSPAGYVTLNEKGIIIEANLTAATLLGVAKGAMVKQLLSKFILKEDQDIYYKHRKQLFDTGEPQSCELRVVKKDGTSFWMKLTANAAQDVDGSTLCRIVMTDITDRKLAEESGIFKTALLEAQMASSIDGILIVDAQGKKILQNQRTVELWKIPQHIADNNDDEMQVQYVKQMTKNPEKFIEQIVHLYKHPEEISQDVIELTDGTVLERYSTPLMGKNGQHYGRIWMFHDITALKQTEQALQESEQRFRGAFDTAAHGMALVNPDGQFLSVNQSLCDILGYTEKELLATDFQTITYAEDLSSDLDYVHQLLADEIPSYNMEKRYIHKDGHIVWVYLSVSLVRDSLSKPVYFVSQIQDITERKRAEEALVSSEQKWHNVLVATPQIGISLNPQAEIIFANTHFLKLTGWKEQEVLGRDWFDMFIPENIREEVRSVFSHTMDRRDVSGYSTHENDIITRSGELRNIGWFNVLTKDAQGRILDITSLGIDITERNKAREALQESEKQYRHLFELANEGLIMTTLDGQIHKVNQAFSKMHGYSLDELKRMYIWDLDALGEKLYEDRADIIRRIQAGETVRFDVEHYHKDGHIFPLTITSSMIDIEGKKYYLSFNQDITERKQAEEALKEKTAFLDKIIESAALSTWISDEKGTAIRTNPACLEFFGATEDEVIGKYNLFQDVVLEKNGFMPEIRRVFEKGEHANIVIDYDFGAVDHVNVKNATHKIINTIITPIKDASGKVSNAIVQAIDLTELKRMEAALIQSSKMESIGRLAGGVAHDYNNMLGVIIGFTELAMEKTDPAQPIHADLTEVLKAASRSATITRQFLAFARNQVIAPEVLDLNGTIDGMLKMLRPFIGEDIDLAWLPGADLWPVRMDPAQIDQILANLCVNARDAITDSGKITIETENFVFDDTTARNI